MSGLKEKPFLPTSTDWVALEAEPLSVELAVVVVASLDPCPPYWAPTRGRHKKVKVQKDALIITVSELDEKIMKVKVCVDSPAINFKESGDMFHFIYFKLRCTSSTITPPKLFNESLEAFAQPRHHQREKAKLTPFNPRFWQLITQNRKCASPSYRLNHRKGVCGFCYHE